MATTTDIRETYLRQFADTKAALPGSGLSWLAQRREDAAARFAALGLPTRRLEAWKFTDLRPLTRTTFVPAPGTANGIDRDGLGAFLPDDLACHQLVFVNGHHRPDLSETDGLPAGVRLTSLAAMLDDDPALIEAHIGGIAGEGEDAPAALNTALMRDGAVLAVEAGVVLDRPVHLLYLGMAAASPAANHLRNLIVARAASRISVIETYAAPADTAYWSNVVTDVVADSDAEVRHIKLQRESTAAFHLAATRVSLAEGSTYRSFAASVGARLSRNEISVSLDGTGIDCRLDGAYLARGRQHMDTTTVIDHLRPGSYSNEHYRGVIDDSAHGVFQGRIVVHQDAQKTDAHQLNRNLLLSEAAQIDTKPELEIHADDVKCSHGATAGELDADALFYLHSRGLDAETARRLLIEAFVGEIIEAVDDAGVRAFAWRAVADWLPGVSHD